MMQNSNQTRHRILFACFSGRSQRQQRKRSPFTGASDPRTPNPAILVITKLSHPMRPVARPVGWLNAHVGVSAHYFKASSPHIPAIHQPQTIPSRTRHWWTQAILHTDTLGLRWTRAAAAILPEQILEALNVSLLYGGQNGGIRSEESSFQISSPRASRMLPSYFVFGRLISTVLSSYCTNTVIAAIARHPDEAYH